MTSSSSLHLSHGTHTIVSPSEQALLLEESLATIRQQGHLMRKSLEGGKTVDALKHAALFLNELRTGQLNPQKYYELYMAAFNELRFLFSSLAEGKEAPEAENHDLYELVQYTASVIPRLYLMITVGAAYISLKRGPRSEILKDMLEMCRGVQHPTRGLFLRNYLSSMCKDFMADKNDHLELGESLSDSVSFVLSNFVEMNKLWVRMQYQGHTRERQSREMERKELKLLVGTNLVRLSQLECMDLELYKPTVLPQLLEQIISCNDAIAQEYLMDVIINVFPDDLHLATLDEFLNATAQLLPEVSVKDIIISLMNRLSAYVGVRDDPSSSRSSGVLKSLNLFQIFWSHANSLIEERSDIPINDIMALCVALMNLSVTCYPDEHANVDHVLKLAHTTLLSHDMQNIETVNPSCTKLLVRLLQIPLDLYKNALLILTFENFSKVLEYLGHSTRKVVSKTFVRNLLTNQTPISSVDQITVLFAIIESLIEDQKDQPPLIGRLPRTASTFSEMNQSVIDIDDYAEEQELVAKLIHLLIDEDKPTQLILLTTAFKLLNNGGMRLRFVIPSLVSKACSLASELNYGGVSGTDTGTLAKQTFQFIYQLINTLQTKGTDSLENITSSDSQNFVADMFTSKYVYDLILKLYLQASLTADSCKNEEMAYEYAVQALLTYEEHISDSKSQIAAIHEIVLALSQSLHFSNDNYDTLSTKALLYSTKLLRKPDQCNSICSVAHLFWLDGGCPLRRDSRKVLECLQKALKIADSCMDATLNVSLFISILNSYIYFYENGCDSILPKYLNGLVDLIATNLANLETSNASGSGNYEAAVKMFEKGKVYLQTLLVSGPSNPPASTISSPANEASKAPPQMFATESTTTIAAKNNSTIPPNYGMIEHHDEHEHHNEEVKSVSMAGYSEVENGFRSLNLPSFAEEDQFQ